MTPWHPIAELPDALKDGREVLLWSRSQGACICEWRDDEPDAFPDFTHFAEITPPSGIPK